MTATALGGAVPARFACGGVSVEIRDGFSNSRLASGFPRLVTIDAVTLKSASALPVNTNRFATKFAFGAPPLDPLPPKGWWQLVQFACRMGCTRHPNTASDSAAAAERTLPLPSNGSLKYCAPRSAHSVTRRRSEAFNDHACPTWFCQGAVVPLTVVHPVPPARQNSRCVDCTAPAFSVCSKI